LGTKRLFQKLTNTEIWEVRIQIGNNIFRILGFIEEDNLIILTNGFQKKTQKTPKKEIEQAEKRMKDYLRRKRNG
jgi:phage-related protein